MYEVDQVISYGNKGICKIVDTMEREINDKLVKYYILQPIYEDDSLIYVPQNNEELTSKFKPVITKSQIFEILNIANNTHSELVSSSKEREAQYKEILDNGSQLELLSLIKSLYIKKEQDKKLPMVDSNAFMQAEKKLYRELAYVLDIDINNVVPFIKNYFNKKH